MTRLAIALVVLVSCSRTGNPGSTTVTGTGSEAAPIVAKRIAVSWGIEKQGEMADLFLATTDETGKQVSHSLGRYKGECVVIVPAREMNAISGVACRTGGTGTELHAVAEHGDAVVVLKMGIDDGVKQDPMAREEVLRVPVPLGTKIEAGS
jgi:hypothetical protein